MKKKVNILYNHESVQKTFTFTYTPKTVIPEIEKTFSKEMTIDGVYRFSNISNKYIVKIETYVTDRELAELYTIVSLVDDYIYYEVDDNIFKDRNIKNKIKGKLTIDSMMPPQKPSHILYKIECSFYEI